MSASDFTTLLAESNDYLRAAISKVSEEFKIGDFPGYDYDLASRQLWWSHPGDPTVRVKMTLVGTFATESKIWLWAWANPQFEKLDLGDIEKVREFGEEHGIEKLTEPEWTGEDSDGWELAAIASRVLGSAGAYRSPNRNGFLYLVFDQPELIPEEEKAMYLALSGTETDPS